MRYSSSASVVKSKTSGSSRGGLVRESRETSHIMAAIFPAQEDDMFSRNLQKRYNGLIMVRTRAIKGKGAWYWYHLEPILLQNQETGTAKALKLRCGLCSALFSASNPSRTASEHLKRGTCPNFRSPEASSNGIMAKIRKHDQLAFPAPLPPLALIPSPCSPKQMVPNPSIRPQLPQTQIDTAFNLLTEWFYESCGYVSLSTLNHPKFKAFLHHVGLPPVNKNDILGRRLDAKYVDAKFEFEDKLHDAMFFQLSTNGWKNEGQISSADENALVNVTLNLPNGSSLFHRVLFLGTSIPSSDYIRDVLSSTIREVSDGNVLRCAGVVADISNINSEALRELELQHHWMVNLTCQTKALHELLRDFFKRLPLFASTASLCHKLVQIYKSHQLNDIIICLNRNQTLSLDQTSAAISSVENFARFACAMTQAARVFANKAISSEPLDQELSDAIQDPKFWRELDSVVSLAKLIKTFVQEMEEEKPCLGQCLPLWEEVKSRIKGWCNSFSIEEKPVMELVNRRFSKNYHQAWAASFILDPLYLVEDNCGRYLPPFKVLSPEQQKDVAKIITRLTKKEEAHIALMELMKWRTEGLDPVYARAVQAKESDPVTGKMKVVNPRGGRLVWETYLTEYKVLRKVAARLIFLQATTGQLKWNEPFLSLFCSNSQSNSAVERAQKVLFVSAHGRLERKEFTDEQEKDLDNNCIRQNIYSPAC